MEETNFYLTVRMIKAYPCTKEQALQKGYLREIRQDEFDDKGYIVINPFDKLSYWLPKDEFDSMYFGIKTSSFISKEDVDSFIVEGTIHKLGDKTCVVLDSTITGFDTIGTAACVNPKTYREEIGVQIARKEIKDKIWAHLGFVLQWALNGIKC